MKKQSVIIIAIVIFASVLSQAVLLSRTIAFPSNVKSFFSFGSNYSISDKIAEGIGLLKASPRLEYSPSKRQIALAILDKKTGKIEEKRIWIDTNNRVIDDGTNDFDIRIVWWNSFNSLYQVGNGLSKIVVANKFMIPRDLLPEQEITSLVKDAPNSKYFDIVFAPYSESIHWPDVLKEGVDYIDRHVEMAYKDLEGNGVMSVSEPGKLVSEVIPKSLVKNIILAEHVDPGWLAVAEDGGKTLVERVFIIIGANKEWAYRYTSSKAGAYGLGQFMEATYDTLVGRYPSARLISDRTHGMADHTNAFKAIALLFDNDRAYLQKNLEVSVADSMLAAAYNGGPSRVITAVKRNADNWATSSHLAAETRDYVKKFEMIKKLQGE